MFLSFFNGYMYKRDILYVFKIRILIGHSHMPESICLWTTEIEGL